MAVAVGDEVEEDVQVFQAQRGLLAGDPLPGVGGGVAGLADEVHAAQEVVVHDGAELVGVHQADQLVVPGHDKIAVHGVHPLDGRLHAAAAGKHAGRRVDLIDPLRRHRTLCEGGKIGIGCEVVKVGHREASFRLFCQSVRITPRARL